MHSSESWQTTRFLNSNTSSSTQQIHTPMVAIFKLCVYNSNYRNLFFQFYLFIVEDFSNLHPYKGEISKLMKNPSVGILECLDGCEKGCLEMEGCFVWVETEAQLRELVVVLSNEKVFAVDTEQHSYRSFLGFTALVQVRIRVFTSCSSKIHFVEGAC